jgi:hypothetical protein
MGRGDDHSTEATSEHETRHVGGVAWERGDVGDGDGGSKRRRSSGWEEESSAQLYMYGVEGNDTAVAGKSGGLGSRIASI